MGFQTPPPPTPVTPTEVPVQYVAPPVVSHKADDLRINDETTNNQVNSSNASNSQVNVNQNNVHGNFEPEFLDSYLSVTPRWQASVNVSVTDRGDTVATASITHNFGVPKIAKKYREGRYKEMQQRIAQRNMNAQMQFEAHCAKLMNSGYTTPGCNQTLIATAKTEVRVQQTHTHPQAKPQSRKEVKGYW